MASEGTAAAAKTSRWDTLRRVIEHLRTRALYTPGVFRVTCNMTEVRQLLRRCDEGQHNCLAECDDNHMVAGLLLEVLRELPTSLFDFEDFLALPQPSNFADVGRLVNGYSEERREVVRQVVQLLRALHVNAPANEVNLTHLVSIFSPVLCRPPSGAFMSIRHIKALPHIQASLHTLIQYYDLVFRRTKAWSAQSEQDAYHSAVLVLAITEELVDGTVTSWFCGDGEAKGNTDSKDSAHEDEERGQLSASGRWAQVSPKKTAQHHQEGKGGDNDTDVVRGSVVCDPVEKVEEVSEGRLHLTDVDTFNLSDDEDGSGSNADAAGKVDTAGKASASAAAAGRGATGATGSGRSRTARAAAEGLSVNVDKAVATAVSAPVSPPTPWVASPATAAAAAAAGTTRNSDPASTAAAAAAGTVPPSRTSNGTGTSTSTSGGSGHHGTGSSSKGLSDIAKQRPRRPSGALRRKQVAEYRKVRVQVKRFEEVYRQKHGVVPKGRARAPVKELYSRYRHLKQVVRDGSALHIQTVYRGFRVRRRYQLPSSKAREGAPTPSRVAGHRANARVAAASSGRRKRTESTDSSHAIDRDAFDRTAGATTHAAHSIPALKADKGELKKQLKQFDVDFKAKHGRMPSNEDKEPIRHLYRRYNELKETIAELEAEAAWGSDSAGGSSGKAESTSDTYRQLRREKRMLQLKLKTYEDEFLRLTGRKVRYHKDIRPVEAEYQRYKEVKQQIQQLAKKHVGSP